MRLLHWGMLALFAATIPLGLYMTDLPLGARKVGLYALHKSIGLTLLALALARLAWRATEHRPAQPPMAAWQARAADITHAALYALMFAIPLSGWLYNSAAAFPLRWFGLVNVPALVPASPALKLLAHQIHVTAVWVLLTLVVLHVAAAFWHHFVDRDRTLALMVPGVMPRHPGAGR